MSPFVGAVRIGARISGANMRQVQDRALAAIADDVLATIRGTSDDKVRDLLRNTLIDAKHPDWYEGEPDEEKWRLFLFGAVRNFWNFGHDFKPTTTLRLLKGGAK